MASTTTIFYSCKKDAEYLKKSNNSPNTITNNSLFLKSSSQYMPDIGECNEGVSIYNGYIRFSNYNSLINTILCLRDKDSIMEENFLNDWGYIESDSILNFIEDSIGYNTEAVFEQFESQFDYVSLRSVFFQLENEWSENLPLDTNNYPEHPIGDKEFQTVINNHGVFIVQDTIYKIQNNGDYYRILALNLSILDSIIEEGTYSGNNPKVIYKRAIFGRDTCRAYGSSGTRWRTKGKYTMGYRTYYYTVWPVSRAAAYTVSKVYGFGMARKYRTEMRAEAGGIRYKATLSGNCGDEYAPYTSSIRIERKRDWTRGHTWYISRGRYQSCGHKGYHYTKTVGTALSCVTY